MYIDIYKDPLQKAYLFGTAVLYSDKPIPPEDVPQDWYSYEFRGTVQHPDKPYVLEDRASYNYAGSVLSPLPLKRDAAQSRLVKDKLLLTSEQTSLADLCAEEDIECPPIPIRHMLRPASPDEAGLFYALEPEKDEELGAIGHLRVDFGHRGQEFWHSWWQRGPEELNSPEFKAELDDVVNDLRKSVLKDLSSMRRYCCGHGGAITGGACCQNYGFVLETERYIYRLRCNPIDGDYQAYLACFDKQAQQMGLTEKGQQLDDESQGMTMGGLLYCIASMAVNDWLPLVDYRQPAEPVKYDSTAAMITACGLLEIASHVDENEARFYIEAAYRILRASEAKFANWNPDADSIMTGGTYFYHDPTGENTEVPIIYADYYLIEAVLRLKGKYLFEW